MRLLITFFMAFILNSYLFAQTNEEKEEKAYNEFVQKTNKSLKDLALQEYERVGKTYKENSEEINKNLHTRKHFEVVAPSENDSETDKLIKGLFITMSAPVYNPAYNPYQQSNFGNQGQFDGFQQSMYMQNPDSTKIGLLNQVYQEMKNKISALEEENKKLKEQKITLEEDSGKYATCSDNLKECQDDLATQNLYVQRLDEKVNRSGRNGFIKLYNEVKEVVKEQVDSTATLQ